MTYDEWKASQSPTPSPNGLQLGGAPDPPFLNRPDLSQIMIPPGVRDWWKYMNTPQPLPKGITDWWKWMNTPLGANDPMGPRPTTNPSFYPMQGEKLALQMPGDSDRRKQFLSGYADPPIGMREMPRAPGVPFVPERNTQVIAGPPQPQSTPYPRPPWNSFRNWMNTGEQGPMSLDSHRPGYYPPPYQAMMPEAYDANISGGALG